MDVSLSDYIPEDRRAALAHGQTLPGRAQGAALFADITGFTPLTEQLTQQLGPRRGIEELTRRINAVYDAIISQVEGYGGSVVSFAGDSITCWFDDQRMPSSAVHPSSQAVTAAQSMQAAMAAFPELSLKLTVATGPARRFAVGDPKIQLLDTLAGGTIARLATAEHLARGREILVDEATVQACGDGQGVTEWRTDARTAQRFAVLARTGAAEAHSPENSRAPDLPLDILRPWVLSTVYVREQNGLGEFLTELRPAVALFLHFGGIEYDGDESAGDKLDRLICQVQQVVTRYEGTLMQLTIGDKGSYLQVCFGAPVAHEDDARRAGRAALTLLTLSRELPFLSPVRIGISRGTLRTGAYGGASRRTYGVMGDDVNLAARLMQSAGPGEIWVSGHVASGLGDEFGLAPMPPLPFKGKAEPIPIFAVTDEHRRRATRLLEPAYRLPMMGRRDELILIASKLEQVKAGQGQIIGVTAEAGMGKSRLVAEAIRLAYQMGFAGYGGACESSGTNTPYLAWKPIWQAFFDLDPTAPIRRQLRHLENEIEDRAPDRRQALPLLGPLLDIQIEENEFTRTLEPKNRRNALVALLEDCLKAAAREEPILIVIEDAHWIDPLSHDLLESLARAAADSAVCFLLAFRPPELERLQAPRVENMRNYTKIQLSAVTRSEAEGLIRAKLAQLYPERNEGLPARLAERVITQAEGNPFFIEELLNYLRDRALDPWALQDEELELPVSLHTLILSRMDQLSETQKATLKVASIIGRLFPFAWLRGYYPTLGAADAVKGDLEVLARLDITPLDTPEPELAYLFKHVVTQEVAYQSLAYATRAQLHEQLAQYLEAHDADKYLDRLAFHYSHSENRGKQREYLLKAGEAAQAAFANAAALDYYDRLLPLSNEPREQVEIHLKRGAVLALIGEWKEAEVADRRALELSEPDSAGWARAEHQLGKVCRMRGDYGPALEYLRRAIEGFTKRADQAGLAEALVECGSVFWRQGEYGAARVELNRALALAREIDDRSGMANALNNLGIVADLLGEPATARALYQEGLSLQRERGNKEGIAVFITNLATLARSEGDYATATALNREALAAWREIGDKLRVGAVLSNMGNLALDQGDAAAAQALYEESLTLRRELGDKWGILISIINLADCSNVRGEPRAARAWLEEGMVLARELGDNRLTAEALRAMGFAWSIEGNYAAARREFQESLALVRAQGNKDIIIHDLVGLATVALHNGNIAYAARLLGAAEGLRVSVGKQLDTLEHRVYEQTVAAARTALGDQAFSAAFEAGQKMTVDEAVAFALGGES